MSEDFPKKSPVVIRGNSEVSKQNAVQRMSSLANIYRSVSSPINVQAKEREKIEPGKPRHFRCINGAEYVVEPPCQGSVPPPNTPPPKIPVFLGPDGTLFDLSYTPILDRSPVDSDKWQYISDLPQLGGAQPIPPFPDSENFSSYLDYEQAVLDWRMTVVDILGFLQLPHPVGRFYYRPKVVASSGFNRDELTASEVDPHSTSSGPIDENSENTRDDSTDGSDPSEADSRKKISVSSDTNLDSDSEFLEEMKKWIMDRDPWDTSLVPPEPHPSCFNNFKDYEDALKRWSNYACSVVQVIPPHPNQLRTIISLIPKGEKRGNRWEHLITSSDTSEEEATKPLSIKISIKERHVLPDPVYEVFKPEFTKPLFPLFGHSYPKTKRSLKRPPQFVVESYFQTVSTILSHRLKVFPKRKTYVLPVTSRKRGTLPRLTRGVVDRGMEDFISTAVLRLDFDSEDLPSSYYFPRGAEGKDLEFRTAKDDLASFSYKKLAFDKKKSDTALTLSPTTSGSSILNGPSSSSSSGGTNNTFGCYDSYYISRSCRGYIANYGYINEVREQILRLKYCDYHDCFNSWNYPALDSDLVSRFLSNDIQDVTASAFSIDDLIRILKGNAFLDQFHQILSEAIPSTTEYEDYADEESPTYSTLFLSVVKTDNWSLLLKILQDTSSKITHSKVSLFVCHVLGTSKIGRDVLQRMATSFDVWSLYWTTYAATFFLQIPTDIYPYHPTTWSLVLNKFSSLGPPGLCKLTQAIWTYYYLSVINSTISSKNVLLTIVNLKPSLNETMEATLSVITSGLREMSNYCEKIWTLIQSRSSSVSNLSTFIMIQLLRLPASSVLDLLLKEGKLIECVRLAARSKFSHTQYAVERIWQILLQKPYVDYLYSAYEQDNKKIDEDLCNFSSKQISPLLPRLVMDMIERATEKVGPENLQRMTFLLGSGLFHRLLKKVTTAKTLEKPHEFASYVLRLLGKVYFQNNLLLASEEFKSKKESTRSLALMLTPPELQTVINFLASPEPKKDLVRILTVKENLLNCLRYLLKVPKIFEILKKESGFYVKLVSFCRDGKLPSLNHSAWHTFYHILKYHPGTIEYLDKNQKILATFMDIIGTSSGNAVIINSLHYISKLFLLPSEEQKKIAAGRVTIREERDVKSIEKDIKYLVNFFITRHQFIKIHMIYKKIVPPSSAGSSVSSSSGSLPNNSPSTGSGITSSISNPTNTSSLAEALQSPEDSPISTSNSHKEVVRYFPGGPFSKLAFFYEVLTTAPVCQKLYKETLRNAEYRDGISKVSEMFTPKNS